MNLHPSMPSPELIQMKNELKKIFDDLLRRNLIPPTPQPELVKAIDDLAPVLLLLKKNSPEQFRQLTDEYKAILVFSYSKANNNPAFKQLKDQLMELVLTPASELSKRPDLRLTLSKMKLLIDKLINKLVTEEKITPKLALHFRREYEKKSTELEKNLKEKKLDPRPLGGNPAFARLFLDCLTLTLIDEFNFDIRTGMYRFVIGHVAPNYGGYDDPSPWASGDALSLLDKPSPKAEAARGTAEPETEKHITPSWVKTKPPTTGGTAG